MLYRRIQGSCSQLKRKGLVVSIKTNKQEILKILVPHMNNRQSVLWINLPSSLGGKVAIVIISTLPHDNAHDKMNGTFNGTRRQKKDKHASRKREAKKSMPWLQPDRH